MNKENPRWEVRELESWKYTLKYPVASYCTPGGNYTENSPMPKPQRNSYFSGNFGNTEAEPTDKGMTIQLSSQFGSKLPVSEYIENSQGDTLGVLWKLRPPTNQQKSIFCVCLFLCLIKFLKVCQYGKVKYLWVNEVYETAGLFSYQVCVPRPGVDIFQKHLLLCCLSPDRKSVV